MFDAAPIADPAPPLQQSDGFARALHALGETPLTLPSGAVLLRQKWGPLRVSMLTRAAVDGARLDELQQAGLRGPVILSPEAPLPPGQLPLLPLVSPAYLAELDLSPDLAVLETQLRQKWRNRLNHARRHSLRVTRQNMPIDPAHWLLQADLKQQGIRGYRHWPPVLTCAYARENPGCAKLFMAHLDGKPVAALLVLRHGQAATYHIGHTHAAGREAAAQNLLLWEAICWLKRKGVTRFELGLIDTEASNGLARFKLGTGARLRALGGTWLWWPPVTSAMRPLARLDRGLMRAA